MKLKSNKQQSGADRLLVVLCYIIGTVFAAFCLVPLLYLLSGSFSPENVLLRGNLKIIPIGFTTIAYKTIFSGVQIFKCYGVSIGTTVLGTLASLVFSSFFAYPLASGRLKYGNAINFYVYFTMIFSGGLVPTFIWYTQGLHLTNTYWVLVLPTLMIPWNMFLLRNFFKAIPSSLAESARIDGCSEPSILFRIILPCSKPALATVGLFYALGYWNEWYNAMLYIQSTNKYPLQYFLQKIVSQANVQLLVQQGLSINTADLPSESIKMATAVAAIGPIILVYPFVQKYFVSGLTIGAVKG